MSAKAGHPHDSETPMICAASLRNRLQTFVARVPRRGLAFAARARRNRRQRPILTLGLAFAVISALFFLLVSALPIARAPLLAEPGMALADLAHRYRASTPAITGPSQLILVDDQSWYTQIARAKGRIPPAVPASLTAQIIERARLERIPLLVIDIDITVAHPTAEEEMLNASLMAWARDPGAGVLLLARRPFCPTQMPRCEVHTPYDATVEDARNILWVSPIVEIDHRGTLRWIQLGAREPGANPNIAVTAAHLIARIGSDAAPARPVRIAAHRIKTCLRQARVPARNCLGERFDAPDGKLLLPFGVAMPEVTELEDLRRPPTVETMSIRSAQDFVTKAWLGDSTRVPVFMGVSHRNGGDRFTTPLGTHNGVVVIAAAAMEWAQTGYPDRRSASLGIAVAIFWGALAGTALGATEHARRWLLARTSGRTHKWVRRLVEPFTLLPLVMIGVNIVSFAILVQLPLAMTDWRVLTIAGLLLTLITTLKSIHDMVQEVQDDRHISGNGADRPGGTTG